MHSWDYLKGRGLTKAFARQLVNRRNATDFTDIELGLRHVLDANILLQQLVARIQKSGNAMECTKVVGSVNNPSTLVCFLKWIGHQICNLLTNGMRIEFFFTCARC